MSRMKIKISCSCLKNRYSTIKPKIKSVTFVTNALAVFKVIRFSFSIDTTNHFVMVRLVWSCFKTAEYWIKGFIASRS